MERYAESAWRKFEFIDHADLSIITHYFGIRILHRSLSNEMKGAYIITPKGRSVIVLRKFDPPVQQRWTLAHEIGHHILRKPMDRGRICAYGLKESNPKIEKRCNRFAAALLMPHWVVKEEFERLAGNPTGRIFIMAERFGVSISAMRYRLRELGLTKFAK
jgi:Zn-dependent peptidase ImmA (M78 family)